MLQQRIHWHDSHEARAILAGIDRKDFHQTNRVAVVGRDFQEWAPSNEKADKQVAGLKAIREARRTEISGYATYADAWADGGKEAAEWLIDTDTSLASISDAVEAEFARRDDRSAKVRVRPSRDEVEAFKGIVGAGLPICGSARG